MKLLCPEAENFSHISKDRITNLTSIFEKTHFLSLSQSEFKESIVDYNTVLIRLKHSVTADMMHADLKVIISPTTGLDHIDLNAAKQKGIKVISLQGEDDFLKDITSTAEHTLALILAIVRKIPSAVEAVKSDTFEPYLFRGMQLKDKTLGIIGYGRLGQLTAKYCTSLGMNILKYDPYNSLAKDSLEKVLSDSDIITIHAPLNKETENMIGQKQFDMMKQGTYLINTSRGEIVDEVVMIDYLWRKHLAGVAVDVISKRYENMIKDISPKLNLIITPHIGGACEESIRQTDMFIIDKFIQWHQKYGKGSRYNE